MRIGRTILIYALLGPPLGWLVYACALILFDAETAASYRNALRVLLFGRDADVAIIGEPAYFTAKVLTCLTPTLICWLFARRRSVDMSKTSNDIV